MSGFRMCFEWPQDGPAGDLKPHGLAAETLEMAKMEAAMVYAGASFRRTPPQAYRIEGPDGTVVYRFPEMRRAMRR